MKNKFDNRVTEPCYKFNYYQVLQEISNSNSFLSDIADKLLKRPDLIMCVPAWYVSNFTSNIWGLTPFTETANFYKAEVYILNSKKNDHELLIHELIHFFTIPALKIAEKNIANSSAEDLYYKKLIALWKYCHNNNYSAINNYSFLNNTVEFAVNFTNKESIEKLKKLGIHQKMVEIFFEYYLSIPSAC